MTFGSLFAGIGGLDLGLERAGMTCKWQVEIDDYARRVLAKHWPNVQRWDDITTFEPSGREWSVDLICGGFPCQDISTAGKRAGLHGDRSGLFFDAVRVVESLRPRWLLLENVAALLNRGLDEVLGTLAEIGFDAEWHCLQAADFGAPHIRDRVFIIANANGKRLERQRTFNGAQRRQASRRSTRLCNRKNARRCCNWWATEPELGRVAYGIPARVDRLRGLGNAVVPQIAEWLGRQIMEAENETPEH
jgi:DNA (cytosine-5)-methyltransferase 1